MFDVPDWWVHSLATLVYSRLKFLAQMMIMSNYRHMIMIGRQLPSSWGPLLNQLIKSRIYRWWCLMLIDSYQFFYVFRQGGIESIANDYSLRQTNSYVAFGEKQRTLGKFGGFRSVYLLDRCYVYHTGCSLNIVFFSELFKIFWTLPSVSVCVHTPGRQNTSAAAEPAELRKITKF